MSPAVAAKLYEHLRRHPATLIAPAGPRAPALSDRELQVLRLLVEGYENPEIAARLFVSVGTVKNDVAAVLHKLGVDNRVQAAVRAVRLGLA